jgi:hypothetical protein
MKRGAEILKRISKQYTPFTIVELKFRGYDLSMKTDEQGNAILLFLSKKQIDGTIRGERFARRLLKRPDGSIIKDHWDCKGKA